MSGAVQPPLAQGGRTRGGVGSLLDVRDSCRTDTVVQHAQCSREDGQASSIDVCTEDGQASSIDVRVAKRDRERYERREVVGMAVDEPQGFGKVHSAPPMSQPNDESTEAAGVLVCDPRTSGSLHPLPGRSRAEEGRGAVDSTLEVNWKRDSPPSRPAPSHEVLCPDDVSEWRAPLTFVAAAAGQGKRAYMEDRHVIMRQLSPHRSSGPSHRLTGIEYVAVLDGHGGSRCVDWLAEHLHQYLASHPGLDTNSFSTSEQFGDLEKLGAVFSETFHACDDAFLNSIRAEGLSDGATALCTLICGTRVYVANVGDTRAVLARLPVPREGSRGAVSRRQAKRPREVEAVRISVDHKPNLPLERARVRECGGRVTKVRGVWRVFAPTQPSEGECSQASCEARPSSRRHGSAPSLPSLAISRAFGNFALKELAGTRPLIDVEPHVAVVQLQACDRFLILATDGLWDAIEEAQAVRLAAGAASKILGLPAEVGGPAPVSNEQERKGLEVIARATGHRAHDAEGDGAWEITSKDGTVQDGDSTALATAALGNSDEVPQFDPVGAAGNLRAIAALQRHGDVRGVGTRPACASVHMPDRHALAAQAAANALVEAATSKGSEDNVTVVVILFKWTVANDSMHAARHGNHTTY